MKPFHVSLCSCAIAVVATITAADDCARLRTELEAAQARVGDLEAEVVRLRGELATVGDARLEREREFLRFTQGIAQLKSLATSPMPAFTPRVPDARPKILDVSTDPREDPAAATPTPTPPVPAVPPAAAELRSATDVRDRAIYFSLRTLLAAEQVTSLDLLESGELHGSFVGPVVLRVLDDRGRPLGAISAERLRLEGSRAARMVTLVLEEGYERRGGVKIAFEGGPPDESGRAGVRRIALPECDPKPWIESVPELFGSLERERDIDDARHDLGALRASLNDLLKGEAASGWYRVQGIGGVQGRVFRDVALDRLDKDGRVERRYFADRMAIYREPLGLQLSLEGGSHVKGDSKTPFLDGRCRIFLPRADVSRWEKAGIPGLEPLGETRPTAGK